MSNKKTVFVLGAGFSAAAGAPSQEKLVEKIFEIAKKHPFVFKKGNIHLFKEFLTKIIGIPTIDHSKIPLEDIFTPLDRCLIDNVSYRNLSPNEIEAKRILVYYLIGKSLQFLLGKTSKTYINDLAQFIVQQSSKRAKMRYKKGIDPVSIISTNWDILLDNSIHDIIQKRTSPEKAVVDYCCHISSYHKHDHNIKPGLEILGGGGFNVKLIKLHGSLNWLQCNRCQRLYVAFDEKIAMMHFDGPGVFCRHCRSNFKGDFKSHRLTSNLIMPTFLKDLSNPQYKVIWQNAGIELSEASRVVFIGYSLPAADFEMRQLLSRMVRGNAKIEVVDFGKKSTRKIKDLIGRYKIFFGNRKIDFHTKGAADYIDHFLL